MIDTMRFKIPLSREEIMELARKSVETRRRDHETGQELLRFYKKEVNLGSYDRKVNLIFSEGYPLYLEFSLPKYYYGHNVYLLYPSKIKKVLSMVHRNLSDFFGSFPNVDSWLVQRLDLCYSWKFLNEEQAETVLSVLRSFSIGRKDTVNYESSVMWKGTDWSAKYYLKSPEFYVHDFRQLHRNNRYFDLAYNLLETSKGVLRFEVTLRKAQLERDFLKRNIYVSDLTDVKIKELLDKYFKKTIKNRSGDFMTSCEVVDLLSKAYTPVKAMHLWQFYEAYHDSNPEKRKLLKSKFDRTTIWRYLSDLTKAGVGLPTGSVFKEFSLTIPSDYAVNTDDL